MTVTTAASTARVQQDAPAVAEQVTARRLSQTEARYLLKPAEQWTAADLRDYVVTEMERLHGPKVWVRDPAKELGIFKRFVADWSPELAVAIARHAFTHYRGIWRDAPITPARFTRGNDPYFAAQIADAVIGA